MAFLITALCKHGRASEVVPLFEAQLAVVSDSVSFWVDLLLVKVDGSGQCLSYYEVFNRVYRCRATVRLITYRGMLHC